MVWSTRQGRQQEAVFATLGREHFSTPIDCRLYLPEEWTKHKERCEKAKIAKAQRVFKTKHEQALEMILRARKNGIRFKWVGFDGFYGDNPDFLRKLADNGDEFMADIHSNHRIARIHAGPAKWVERPFQDAKNQCGMGAYQARGWLAWHHRMSMVMLGILFMVEQRLSHHTDIPLLSCADLTTLLKSVLPRRDVTEDEALRQLGVRHRKRKDSIDAAYRKQRKDGFLP